MVRMAYDITEENRRRLELMKAFGTIEGKEVTLQHLVNVAIERLFQSVYKMYSSDDQRSSILMDAMESLVVVDSGDDV